MSERVTEPLRPFPVDSVGRLAITSLSIPKITQLKWSVVEGLSQGMELAEAGEYSGLKNDNPASLARANVKQIGHNPPFAVRVGIELGQIIQPCEGDSPILSLAERRLFFLQSRGVSKHALLQAKHLGFSRKVFRDTMARLCENLEAVNISHAVRQGFRLGLFPPVDVVEAQGRYRDIVTAQRMRGFLRLAYPDYPLDESDDQKILGAVSALDIAFASLWLKVPSVMFELPQRVERLKQWLNGASINDIAKRHNMANQKINNERRTLVSALYRFVPIETLIDRSET